MQTWFSSPAIFAHRGDSAHAPENTLAAFRLAMEKKADGIELDVFLSADGKIVVIHDAELSRTTNGQGSVEKHTFSELQKLNAGAGEPVPALEEVLEILDQHTLLNIELKGEDKRLAAAVTQLVADHKKQDQVIYSSFNPFLLLAIKKFAPDAALGLLLMPGLFGTIIQLLFGPILRPWSLNPHYSAITPKFMKKAKRNQRRVLTYTVNQPEVLRRVFQMGVDGVFTDDPQAAAAIRSEIK